MTAQEFRTASMCFCSMLRGSFRGPTSFRQLLQPPIFHCSKGVCPQKFFHIWYLYYQYCSIRSIRSSVRDNWKMAIVSTKQCHETSLLVMIEFKFNVVLRPQRPYGPLGTGGPGRPPRLSHSSWVLWWISLWGKQSRFTGRAGKCPAGVNITTRLLQL